MKKHITEQKSWLLMTAIFMIALFLRLLAIYLFAWDIGLHFEFAEIAANIANGLGHSWNWYGAAPMQPSAAFPPLYSYFLALFIYIFDEPAKIIFIVQAIINALGVIPAYMLGKQLLNNKAGLIAAIIYAFLPEIIYSVTRIVTAPIIAGLFLLVLYFYIRFKEQLLAEQKTAIFLILGLMIGVLSLIKASMILLYPAFLLGLVSRRIRLKHVIRTIIFLTVGFLLAFSPWLIRNYLTMGKPVIRTTYGYNLWRGNYPGASGTGRGNPDNKKVIVLDQDYQNYIKENYPQMEVEIDEFYTAEAWKFIRAEPSRFIKLTLIRALYFITIDPTHPLTKNIFYLGGYIFVLVFGIWGAFILRKQRKLDIAFFLIPLFNICLYAPVMVLPRYRIIVVWILTVLAPIAILKLLSKIPHFNKASLNNSSS